MKRREFKQRAWRCIKAMVNHTSDFQWLMDDMTVECTDDQWEELCRWNDIAIDVLNSADVKLAGVNPLPIIRSRIEAALAGV